MLIIVLYSLIQSAGKLLWICSLITTGIVESEIEGEFVSDSDELSFPNDHRVQALSIKIINLTFSMTFMVRLLWMYMEGRNHCMSY